MKLVEYADSVNAAAGWSIATKKLYITTAVTMLRWHKARGKPVDAAVTAGTYAEFARFFGERDIAAYGSEEAIG